MRSDPPLKATEVGFILSTGRTFYAFGSMLGLREEATSLTYGWDGTVHLDDDDLDAEFTPLERREIAVYMISLWASWSETGNATSQPEEQQPKP